MFSRVQIIPATEEHAKQIAPNVREADRRELWSALRVTPLDAMLRGIQKSEFARTGFIDGEPVVMWGVAEMGFLGSGGCPWMVGTDKLVRHAPIFLRRCKASLAEMRGLYRNLINYVDERNVLAVNWLKWLGFQIEPAEKCGVDGLPYHKFSMRC